MSLKNDPSPYEPLDVVVEREAPVEEIRALQDVFGRAGLQAEVRADYWRFSGLELPFAVFVLVPLWFVADKFFGGALEKAGADVWTAFRDGGWEGLRRFVQEVGRARGHREGSIVIRDPEGPDVALSDRLPEEAFELLGRIDWAALSNGSLAWREDESDWYHLAPGARRPTPAPRKSNHMSKTTVSAQIRRVAAVARLP